MGISKKSSSSCLDDHDDDEEEKEVPTTCECQRDRGSLPPPSFFSERENGVVFSLPSSPKEEENKKRERKASFSYDENEADSLKGSYHACR